MSDDDDPQFYHPKPLPRRFMCRQSQVLLLYYHHVQIVFPPWEHFPYI